MSLLTYCQKNLLKFNNITFFVANDYYDNLSDIIIDIKSGALDNFEIKKIITGYFYRSGEWCTLYELY